MIVDLEKRWLSQAKCSGKELRFFFEGDRRDRRTRAGNVPPVHPSMLARRVWDKAKIFCSNCPVLTECARDFLGEPDGVWGGMDPLDRRELRAAHSRHVHRLRGPRKVEYAALAARLKNTKGVDVPDIARLMGIGQPTVRYLLEWHRDHLAEKEASHTDGTSG